MPSCNSSCCVVIAAWLGVHPITALVAVVIINRFIIISPYKTRSKLGLYISSHDLSKNCSILDICVVAVGSRSEERRVGKECRYRWSTEFYRREQGVGQ